MERFDRRELLVRTGGLTLAAGAVGVGPALARWGGSARLPLRELARTLDGTVVARGAAGYAQARLLVSTRFDAVHPQAVVFCETVADVQKTVRWAHRHHVHVVPRGGGHSYGGYSTTPGVVIAASRMAGVHVDPTGRVATVGAGARLIDVYNALWLHGLTIPAGSCPTVGIAGLTLGGGVGFSARKLGLTCDRLRSARVVLASGAVVRCSPSQHRELFWALRGGGGGNFGMVTHFTCRAAPVGNVSTFSIEWPWSQAKQAVAAWQKFAPHAPDALFSICNLSASGRGGTTHIVAFGQYFGPESALRSLIAPLVNTGTPTRVSTDTMSYMTAVMKWAGCHQTVDACHLEPRGTLGRETFKSGSDYFARPLPPAGIAALVRSIELRQQDGRLGSLLLDAYGGAINRVPKAATAFVHRDQLFSCQYVASWRPGERAAPNVDWVRRSRARMRPFASGFAYQNYVDPDLEHWQHAYYGSNLPRLKAVKRHYDPHNFFRFAQSIPPH
jgi:FAD binding domain/Berberine and berberine like